MVFYSPNGFFSFLTLSSLTSFISVLCSLFSLRGSWSVVLVADLSALNHLISLLFVCNVASTSLISLLSVTRSLYSLAATSLGRRCLRFALPLTLTGSDIWLSLSHALGFDLQVVGLYRDFDLGIFWWVYDLVLGGGFVIWFWMGVVCGGFAGGGDCGGFFFFFPLWLVVVCGGGGGGGGFFLLWFFFFFFC